jgi:hypothetical protein
MNSRQCTNDSVRNTADRLANTGSGWRHFRGLWIRSLIRPRLAASAYSRECSQYPQANLRAFDIIRDHPERINQGLMQCQPNDDLRHNNGRNEREDGDG